MKKLICHRCEVYLGEIEKGKIKNGAVVLCKGCLEFYQTCDSLNKYQKDTTGKGSTPDFIKDLFGKFK